MPRLTISLLGPFQVTLDGVPVTSFESDKVRALLAYLAVEAGTPQRRERLAGLFWPDQPERIARTNLRHALFRLRNAIGDREALPPFLDISQQTIQFNQTEDMWVDVLVFTELLPTSQPARQPTTEQLQEAVDLVRGDFLEGFSLPGCPAFEEWALFEGERLRRLALEVLGRLSDQYERQSMVERALEYAWRQVELDPWREKARRRVMRLLARSGQRGAALAQYEACRQALAEELGVEPGPETTRLYEEIRDGTLPAAITAPPILGDQEARPPAFLAEDTVQAEHPLFVARERELAWLDGKLETALTGQGNVVFVTGGPGRGKTALLAEFARQAMAAHGDLLVAAGSCNAYSGVGDPYLPFREVLAMLTGDVEAAWAAGAISRDHALRLWAALPLTGQALVDHGPHVVPALIPGPPLLDRAAAAAKPGATWLPQLRDRLERQRAAVEALEESDLFQQVTNLLRTLAKARPLLLVLDDLQWADAASAGLLLHLGRRLAGSPILLAGAYRPEEVIPRPASLRDPRTIPHPLRQVLAELQRQSGHIWLDLADVPEPEGRHFVDSLLDAEPNRLEDGFRQDLFAHAGGHPLFTVELLRAMQERGDLVQDDTGSWVPGPALDWAELPPRVEGVIEARVGRLGEELREFLSVASVEGEEFTAQVVARVQEIGERQGLRMLSRELEKRHRLVRERSAMHLGRQQLSRYRFAHALFQQYLYHDLGDGERALLHRKIAEAIEQCYEADLAPFYSGLANHWSQVVKDGHSDPALIGKTVEYSYKAGQQAKARFAAQEATEFFSHAITLLNTLPASPERAQQELDVQTALGSVLLATKGYGAPEVGQTYDRARMLCQQIGETPQLFQVLWGLGRFYLVRTPLQTCRELGEQLLNLAQQQQAPELLLEARNSLGAASSHLGELSQAQAHLEKGFALYDPQQHRSHALIYGQDPGTVCLSRMTWTLWCLGYPEQALERKEQALALATELDHPFSMAFALNFVAQLHQFRREAQAAQGQAEAAISLCAEQGFDFYQAMGSCLRSWALFAQGQATEGIAQLRQGVAAWKATGAVVLVPYYLALLAEMLGQTGQTETGLTTLAEALATVDQSGERFWEAEIYRLKGELLWKDEGERPVLSALKGRNAERELTPEDCFRRAIDIARCQSGKSLELRATVSLCRLWQAKGKQEQARQMLAEIYNWFAEGFDTADLKEAKALLEELS
jgi:DNA-binding SARP family transcriptional activator/predicted ATPase